MKNILDKLQGGDMRSIGRADEIVSDIHKNPSLFREVFKGLYKHDPVIRMRSADVIEKVTRENPGLLSGYEQKIIKELTQIKQQEVCWHIALILPRLEYTVQQEEEIVRILKGYLSHESKIVNVNAMEALVDLVDRNDNLRQNVERIIKSEIEIGSPAIKARGKKLIKRLSNT